MSSPQHWKEIILQSSFFGADRIVLYPECYDDYSNLHKIS